MSWLTGWTYRKSVPLSRASGAVSNYQMKLLLGESSGATGEDVDCGGLCLSTFNDIRFTTSDDETLLDYHIESITGTTPNQLATIWIEFNSIGTGDTTFYMYYGKADATAVSNGASTFIKYDDFERGSNGDEVGGAWTVEFDHAHISTDFDIGDVAGYFGTRALKMQGLTGATSASATIPLTAASGEYAISARVYKENAAIVGPLTHGNGTKRLAVQFYSDEKIKYYNGSWTDTGATITAADTWGKLEVKNIDFSAGTFDIYYNDALVKSGAEMHTSAAQENIVRVQGQNATDYDSWVDNFIVRNWRAVEPAWGAWGEEEEEVVVVEITITADPIEVSLSIPASTCLNIGSVVDGLITCSLSIPASTYLTVGLVVDGLITYSVSITAKIVIPLPAVRPPSTWITESKDQLPWTVDQDSINWLADKGEGVWDFEEARRVFGYNNNPRFTKTATSKHQPCGHWHKVPSHYERNVVYAGSPLPDRRWMSVSMSSSGQYISLGHYNATLAYYGGLYTSQDYGLTFTCQFEGVSIVRYVSVSPSGKYQYASVEYANDDYAILYSNNYGISWDLSTVTVARFHVKVSFSEDDSVQCLHDYYDTDVCISVNYGDSWTTHEVGNNCSLYEIDADGAIQFYRANNDTYWRSSNYGSTWVSAARPYAGGNFIDSAFIKSGVIYYFLAKDYYAQFYKSSNGGASWSWIVEELSDNYIPAIVGNVSTDGTIVVFLPEYSSDTPYAFYSSDSGTTWNSVAITGRRISNALNDNMAMSSNGKYLTYGTDKYIRVSTDYGASWEDALYYPAVNVDNGDCRSVMSYNGQTQISILPYSTTKSFVFFSGDYGRLWTNYPRRIVEINNQLVIDEIVDEIVNEPVVWHTP